MGSTRVPGVVCFVVGLHNSLYHRVSDYIPGAEEAKADALNFLEYARCVLQTGKLMTWQASCSREWTGVSCLT